MREDFESVKAQVDIKNIATYLLGKPCQGMYRFPGERTPSIKLYPSTIVSMILGVELVAIASDCGAMLKVVIVGRHCGK